MDRKGLFKEEICVTYTAFLFSNEMFQALEEPISLCWL